MSGYGVRGSYRGIILWALLGAVILVAALDSCVNTRTTEDVIDSCSVCPFELHLKCGAERWDKETIGRKCGERGEYERFR